MKRTLRPDGTCVLCSKLASACRCWATTSPTQRSLGMLGALNRPTLWQLITGKKPTKPLRTSSSYVPKGRG